MCISNVQFHFEERSVVLVFHCLFIVYMYTIVSNDVIDVFLMMHSYCVLSVFVFS